MDLPTCLSTTCQCSGASTSKSVCGEAFYAKQMHINSNTEPELAKTSRKKAKKEVIKQNLKVPLDEAYYTIQMNINSNTEPDLAELYRKKVKIEVINQNSKEAKQDQENSHWCKERIPDNRIRNNFNISDAKKNLAEVKEIMEKLLKLIEFEAKDQWKVLCSHPAPPKRTDWSVCLADLKNLFPGMWLNDNIINFYLQYIFDEKYCDSKRNVLLFSSYFYPSIEKFLRSGPTRRFGAKQNPFKKNFLIIPINRCNHWIVAFICNTRLVHNHMHKFLKAGASLDKYYKCMQNVPITAFEYENLCLGCNKKCYDYYTRKTGPCLVLFDSLQTEKTSGSDIFFALRKYLEFEWNKHEAGICGASIQFTEENMPGYVLASPQQFNLSDCGVFLLNVVEKFLQNPCIFYGYPPDVTYWFSQNDITVKRLEILKSFLKPINEQTGYMACHCDK